MFIFKFSKFHHAVAKGFGAVAENLMGRGGGEVGRWGFPILNRVELF